MSSASSYPRCAIEIRSSRILLLYSFLLAFAAMLAPWLSSLPVVPALLADGIVLFMMPALFRWARGGVRRAAWQSDGRWTLVDRKGHEHAEARLLPGIFIGSRLLALRWQCVSCRRKFRVALLADNCDSHERRRLAVRLRLTSDEELFGDQEARV
ncbi:MAG TPA: protein YgfX [Gammaproteobacteria bacterium]